MARKINGDQPEELEPQYQTLNRYEAPPPGPGAVRMEKEAPFPISEDERKAFGNQLAKLEVEEANLKRQKKDMQDDFRKKVNERREEINRISKVMDSGVEVREDEVLVEFDHGAKEVRTYDPATQECLERRTMTTEEIQNPGLL